MEVRSGMFYYRGQSFSGLLCVDCNALYINPEDSFKDYLNNLVTKSDNV
jgi:hypothetical protein